VRRCGKLVFNGEVLGKVIDYDLLELRLEGFPFPEVFPEATASAYWLSVESGIYLTMAVNFKSTNF